MVVGLGMLLCVWLLDNTVDDHMRVLRENLRFWRWYLVPAAILGFCLFGL